MWGEPHTPNPRTNTTGQIDSFFPSHREPHSAQRVLLLLTPVVATRPPPCTLQEGITYIDMYIAGRTKKIKVRAACRSAVQGLLGSMISMHYRLVV